MPAAPTAREEEHVTVESVQGNADRSGNAHDPRGSRPAARPGGPTEHRPCGVSLRTRPHLCWKHEARALLAAAGGPRMHSGDEPPGGASSSGARGPTTGLGPTEAQGCSDPLTCTRDPSTRSPSAGLRRGPDPLARTPAARGCPAENSPPPSTPQQGGGIRQEFKIHRKHLHRGKKKILSFTDDYLNQICRGEILKSSRRNHFSKSRAQKSNGKIKRIMVG